MFIETLPYKVLRSRGAKGLVRSYSFIEYIALRWSANVVGREVYEHLAPLEPEHPLAPFQMSHF